MNNYLILTDETSGNTMTIIYVLIGVLVALILIGVITFIINKNKLSKKQQKAKVAMSNDAFIEALGGTKNIKSHELRGNARLCLVLNDKNLLKRDKIKRFYVDRILEMSDKIILVGENLNPLNEILNNMKKD